MRSDFRNAATFCAVAIIASISLTKPADAQSYAFGYSSYDDNETLTLNFQAGGSTTISTNGFQGWFSNKMDNIAGPIGNTNYITGNIGDGQLANDFFDFAIAGLSGTVTSASLNLNSAEISGPVTFQLFGTPATTAQLFAGLSPNAAIYNELASGHLYGTYGLNAAEDDTTLNFALNGLFLEDINADIADGATNFNFGGTINGPSAVPEPASLLLLGLAVPVFALRRRRRAA